jgi:hypothetical protein
MYVFVPEGKITTRYDLSLFVGVIYVPSRVIRK